MGSGAAIPVPRFDLEDCQNVAVFLERQHSLFSHMTLFCVKDASVSETLSSQIEDVWMLFIHDAPQRP